MMFCRWCGRDNVRDCYVYCPDCGRDVTDCPAPAADLSGERAFCSACGASSEGGYLYCTACGWGRETPATAEKLPEAIAGAAPRLKNSAALITLGRGDWVGAAMGAGAAAAMGVAICTLSAYLFSHYTYDPYDGMSLQLSPWALWVWVHLPSLYLGVAAQYEGFNIGANASFSIPFLFVLWVPLVSLWVGSLLANRGLAKDDWGPRVGQALRMAAVYVALLFAVSLGTGFDMANALPLGLMFGDLNSLGIGIVMKFQWLSVLLFGLLWAVGFGLWASAGRRGTGRLLGHYTGRWSPALPGVGRALTVSIAGGAAVVLVMFFTLGVNDLYLDVGEALPFFILALPNLIIYGLGIGGGAALEVASNIPGGEMYFALSMFGSYAGSHWTLYLLGLLVAGALFWGGCRAARTGGGLAFWQTGLSVAAGYALTISLLARVAQFRADIDMGELSQLMYFLGGEGGRISCFAGTGFGTTLAGLFVIGAIAASLGALAGQKRPPA